MRQRPCRTFVLAVLVLLAAGCGGNGDAGPGGSRRKTVTVLAAASLTEAFQELGRRFEDAHPGVRLSFSFSASSTLVHQIGAGAPADVLATADERTMRAAERARTVLATRTFAGNALAIVVARGNPRHVSSLADLARPDLTVVLCAPEVPCGSLAAAALDRAEVAARPRSLEANVKAVVSKVALGEADVGMAYVTDVDAARQRVDKVEIPPEHNAATQYAIAVVRGSRARPLADAFVALVLSREGRGVLARAGFTS